jgi:hypothetical protein
MLAYLTRVLKTPTIGRCWEELADQARDETWSHEEYLAAVLQRQVAERESAGTTMRIRTAHFPAVKTIEDFNLDHLPSLRRDVLAHKGSRFPELRGANFQDPLTRASLSVADVLQGSRRARSLTRYRRGRCRRVALDEGEAVYESSELGGADEIPPAALVEIAVGVVMQCLALRPADAQSYLLGRARSEARTVDDLAGDIVQRRRP